MKNIKYILYALSIVTLSSCVTGAIDENPLLDELNEAIANSPQVSAVRVNGQLVERDTVSLYSVEAMVGDILDISVDFESAAGTALEELQFEQNFHSLEIENQHSIFPRNPDEDVASNYTFGPVDPGANGTFEQEDIFLPLTGNTMTFTYQYEVLAVDPFVFFYEQHDGDVISIHFTIRASNDHFAHRALIINIIE